MVNYNFNLPDVGEGLYEAEILAWLVSKGDYVRENSDLVEIQTDKAAVLISAPVDGTIKTLGGEEGESIKVGDLLVEFTNVANSSQIPEEEPSQFQKETKEVQDISKNKNLTNRILAAPSIRKAARNAEVDLREVEGTGSSGKILKKDLEKYIEQQKNKTNQVESPETATIITTEENHEVPITGLRKVIFENMEIAKSKAVHCTGMDEVNVTRLVDMRQTLLPFTEQYNIKLTYLPFIVRAVSIALKKHRIFNSTINEEAMTIIYKKQINIGIAMATEQGLLVPVIKNADKKSIFELAKEITELSEKASQKKLTTTELTGSTFTISSTGPKGGMYATPVINYPEVGILGVHRIKKQPIVVDDKIEIGHLMGMSITFDHRIIDGEPAGRFMLEVGQLLNTPELFVLQEDLS